MDADSEAILDLVIDPERYAALVGFLRGNEATGCDMLHQLTAFDDGEQISVLVHLLSVSQGHKVFVRCALEREAPTLPSLSGLFPAATWHERETAEMFGVVFAGHPDPRRLFVAEGLKGYPLRKDWSDPSRVVAREL
ncbi:MAG: NADH-quinone oxidoreductase subunit C [Planctomycetota bacterium]|nr:NADH-quinone oxidoreductase subunit C [Planctomycetota bacterium]